ncbi:AAA family ATPase [Bacillus sp. SD075]|uniref:retron Eco8 family effector endonuclease n=1 Tax=Bacillus sp. SD075 TaxID=2781732 RepID=UPI001A95F5B3|nr:retron Eco8 family effector endonuclease [Bacillus sp. SD075]MBO1000650.1 AAA family ATPase [Bacillus sp. SD075]
MLTKVKLKNCKSIKNLDIKIDKTNCLIGKNGVGKTTFIKSIEFFYDSLVDKQSDFTIFDQNNPYNEFAEIEMNYDFTYFYKVLEGYKLKYLLGEIKKSEFMHTLKKLGAYVDTDNQLKIKLLINKKGEKQWIPNLTYDLRRILKTIYPFYFISTKSYDQTNWETLWDMIGDLAKLPKFNFEEDFGGGLENSNFGSSFGKILDIIKKELYDSNIIINSYSNQEKFLNTLKLQLGGEILQYKYKDLSFFSDGTNSFNYLKLFCSLVNKIAEQKLKIPLLFLDEPEVGLHPKYIDDLMINLLKTSNKNQILIATHSSRILKNVIKMTKNYNVLHAIHENDYTNLTVVNQFLDHREKNVLSDEEASYYFSNKIVFVEGNTELELFNNHNLLNLYPFLRDVDFYSFDADTVNLSTIHPKVRNTKIPFIILIDNDYIFEVDETGKANIKDQSKNFLNPLDLDKFKMEHKKELFYFGEQKKLYYLRKRIRKMSISNKYSFNKYWFTIYGSHYEKFIELIKLYCINYNVYPVSTTIEGTLINNGNVEIFKDWLKDRHPYSQQDIEKINNISKNQNVKTSAFRLIVDGKYDTLKKMSGNKITNSYPSDIKNSYLTISKLKKNYVKTSGWVSDWLDYVFVIFINEKESQVEKEEVFCVYFPELFDIIKKVHNCK